MKIILGAAVAASLLALTAVPAFAIESSIKGSSTTSADAVWAKIGDFCGIGKWHPAIEKCVLSADGKLRTLSLKGGSTIAKSPRSATTPRIPAPTPLSRGRCR
jgi:hypothetical protein